MMSDPPGIPLYYDMGVDKDGLCCHCTVQETNSVEGNIHMPLQRMFESLHASPLHGYQQDHYVILVSLLTVPQALDCTSGAGHSLLGAHPLDPLVHIFNPSFHTHV